MKTALASSLKYTAIAIALAGGMAAASLSQAEAPRAGVTTEQRQVGVFQSIELSGPYRVVVRAQGTPSLTLSGNPKKLAEIETRVSGDTLIVRPLQRNGFSFSFGRKHDEVVITVTTAMLKSLKNNGSGDVNIEQVSSDKLSLESSGPGDITATGSVRELSLTSSGPGDVDLRHLKAASVNLTQSGPGDVELSGSMSRLDAQVRGPGDLEVEQMQAESVRLTMRGPGDVSLSGEVGTLTVEVDGSGALEASHLRVKNATVRARGPGEIELSTVSESLDADLRGSGSLAASMAGKRLTLNMSGPADVEIDGTVDLVNANLSGSGSLEGRHLTALKADVVVRGPGSAEINVQPKAEASTAMLGKPQLLRVDRGGSRQSQQ